MTEKKKDVYYMAQELSLEQRRKVAIMALRVVQWEILRMTEKEFAYQQERMAREKEVLEGLSEGAREETRLFIEKVAKTMEGVMDDRLWVKRELDLNRLRAMVGTEAVDFALETIKGEVPGDRQ